MIFKVAYQKGNRTSIKVQDGDKEIWMGCPKNVYSWCKKSFKEGDEVTVEYTVNNGQYKATRVEGINSKSTTSTPKNDKPKEATTTKKYTNYNSGEYMKRKCPEKSAQIRALSILSSVCSAIQTLTGQIDVNSMGDVIESLYDRFDKKLP